MKTGKKKEPGVNSLPNISRIDLIRKLRAYGCTGPYVGGSHPFMKNGELKFSIPNEHDNDIGPNLLSRILRRANISRDDWDRIE
jgi:predicted RNA binding protein YcfA (HicA-like mRNA interferase family)